MTQRDLADALGVTVPTVSCYENGVSTPSMDVTDLKAQTLGVEFFDLTNRPVSRELVSA
ncbi:helix-turn-helix domain-containing protein [Streptomyces seoulensis]|uniref:helix-turn-helix domain-containing protein n=1 Tax=Streptomyces seoulensis TaxID=73044 RepID=UPI0033A1EDBD